MRKHTEEPGSLLLRTYQLFKQDKRPCNRISLEAGVPFYWLVQFARQTSRNPSVNRVQRLYEFLSGKKLVVE